MHAQGIPAVTGRRRPAGALLAAAMAVPMLLAACAQVPELASTATADLRDSDYPALIPLDLALAPLPPPSEQAAELEASLEGRRARLQARARQLQQPVVDDRTRARMQAGVGR